MTKYTHIKLTPSQILFGGVGIAVVLSVLLFVVYQMGNGSFQLISNASDPCSAYTKQKPLGSVSGIVQSKGDSSFVWNMNGDTFTPKVVVLCAGTQVTRQFGGSMAYADMKVGDRVDLGGWYGDTTNSTVLPAWIRDTSTSQAAEWTSTVVSVNVPDRSFVLNAVDLAVAGVKGNYNLTVKYTTTTQCSTNAKIRTTMTIPCAKIAVGQTAAVTGVLDDHTLTLTATQIAVR